MNISPATLQYPLAEGLSEGIYQDKDLKKQECQDSIDSVVESIVDTVAKGEEVRLVNFGTFRPNPKKRDGKTPSMTREKIEVPAKVVPKFSPGKGLKKHWKRTWKPKRTVPGILELWGNKFFIFFDFL